MRVQHLSDSQGDIYDFSACSAMVSGKDLATPFQVVWTFLMIELITSEKNYW